MHERAKESRHTRREMGAFRVLLGSLHYMGLYMQLCGSARQPGHGEVENHISGNGRCNIRFLSFPPFYFLNFHTSYEGTSEGSGWRRREDTGTGVSIWSHAERGIKTKSGARN